MARKIRFHSLHTLFLLFSFLADKTGGWRMFVKPKMLFGSLLLGVGLTACSAKTENSKEEKHVVRQEIEDATSSNETTKTVDSRNISLKQALRNKKLKNKQSGLVSVPTVAAEINSSCYIADVKVDTVYEVVYDKVDQMPQFPGGEDSLTAYIETHKKYPELALDNGISGKIECRFIVTKEGDVKDVEVIRGGYSSLDKEAIRVISGLPRFIPGKQNGVAVDVYDTLTVRFVPKNRKVHFSMLCYVALKPVEIDSMNTLNGEPVYIRSDRMPIIAWGPSVLSQFLDTHLVYPHSAKMKGVEGKVVCRLLISKIGEIKKIEVVKSLDKACDREAVRVLKRLPKFIPGTVDGKNVAVWYTLPVEFKLPEK